MSQNPPKLTLEQQLEIQTTVNYVSDFFFHGFQYKPKQLRLENAHNEVIYAPDIHRYTKSFGNGIQQIQQEANGKQSVMIIGDTGDRREEFARLYQTFNIPTKTMFEANYIYQNLSEKEARAYAIKDQIESAGGLENYKSMSENMGHPIDEDIEEKYKKATELFENSDLESKISELFQTEEFQQMSQQLHIMSHTIDYLATKDLAKKKAKQLYDANLDALYSGLGETIIIEENGNHSSFYDTILFREEYDKLVGNDPNLSKAEDIIYNAMELHGAIELSKNENKFSFQVANNCHGNFPALVRETFNELEMQLLFPHSMEQSFIPNYDPSQYNQLPIDQILQISQDLQRMSGIQISEQELQNKVDMIFLHDERGIPTGYEHVVNPNTRMTNLGLEIYINNFMKKDNEQHVRIASGHWHKDTDGIITDDKWKQKKSRNFMAKFGKNTYEKYDIEPEKEDYDFISFQEQFQTEYQRAIDTYNKAQEKAKKEIDKNNSEN